MQIADNWSTEYNRKGFRVVLEESDWVNLLVSAGVHPEAVIPLDGKFHLMKLQAAVYSLQAMVEYLTADPSHGSADEAARELAEKKEQLARWLSSLATRYGNNPG